MSPKLLIHQTLHGYQEGHRLLGASLRLPAKDRRRMLTMSDNPDAGSLDPERSLLIGYPLAGEDLYVLAKTWLAPEVDRPGCVWTHSLVLDEKCLGVADPRCFLPLFSRPHAASDAEKYEAPIATSVAEETLKSPKAPEALQTILWTLYQPPLQPVDLRSRALEGNENQEFLLSLWGQQWPRLRQAFSFAEAPRIGRRIDGSLLELQVTESPQRGSWEAGDGPAPPRTVVKPVSEGVPQWCVALDEDFGNPGELRRFLWAKGAQLAPTRSAVWALASLWLLFERGWGEERSEAAVSILERAFPRAAEASELKRAVVLPAKRGGLGSLDEGELLGVLARSDSPKSFDELDLELEKRAKRLVKADPPAALGLLESLPKRLNQAGSQIAAGIASGLGKAQIAAWSKEDPAALAKLVNRSDSLATNPLLWRSVNRKEFWPQVRNPRAAQDRRRAMLRGMIAAHSEGFVDAAFDSWSDAGEMYLTLLNADEAKWRIPELFERVERPTVLRWLKQNGPSLAVAQSLLETWKPKHLAKVPASEWDALEELDLDLDGRTLALLFAAAANPETDLGLRRAIANFEAVVARKQLPKDATYILEAAVGGSSPSGKKAAAMALSRGFLKADWKPIALLGIGNPKALQDVLIADGSGQIVRRLVDELGDRELPREQAQIIYDAVINTEDHITLRKIVEEGRKFIPWL